MENKVVINEGLAGTYTIHGVLGIFIAIPSFFLVSPLVAFILAVVSLHCFFIQTGIEIDSRKKEYRKFSSLYGIRSGEWLTLQDVIRIELMLSLESSRIFSPIGHGLGGNAQFYGRQNSLKSKTYDIVFTLESGKKKLFYEFLKYDLAKKCFRALAQSLAVEAEDKVAEKIAENKLKRSRQA